MTEETFHKATRLWQQISEIKKLVRASSVGEYYISDEYIRKEVKLIGLEDEFIDFLVQHLKEFEAQFEEL